MTMALQSGDFPSQTRVRRNLKNETIVFVYQDLANMGYYAAGVLNTLNKYEDDPLNKAEIKTFIKTSPISFPKLEMIGSGLNDMIGLEISEREFKKLLTLNASALRSLKVHCCNNAEVQHLTDQEVTKLKGKWVDVTKQILVCLYEIRSVSGSHDASTAPSSSDVSHNPLEERLIAARSGLTASG